MKGISNALVIAGLLLAIYAILGRFIGAGSAIGMGFVSIKASTGLIMANILVTLGIAAKLWNQ